MFGAEYTDIVRGFIYDIFLLFKLDYATIRKIEKIIPFEYYPLIFCLLVLIVFIVLLTIIIRLISKKRAARREEEEFLRTEGVKIEEEDRRLSRYHSVLQMYAEELLVSEAQIEYELDKIFKNSPQLKDTEAYHRVSVNRTNKERDIILSNWYMSNDNVDFIKNLIKEEIRNSEVNSLKNEQFIQEAKGKKNN